MLGRIVPLGGGLDSELRFLEHGLAPPGVGWKPAVPVVDGNLAGEFDEIRREGAVESIFSEVTGCRNPRRQACRRMARGREHSGAAEPGSGARCRSRCRRRRVCPIEAMNAGSGACAPCRGIRRRGKTLENLFDGGLAFGRRFFRWGWRSIFLRSRKRSAHERLMSPSEGVGRPRTVARYSLRTRRSANWRGEAPGGRIKSVLATAGAAVVSLVQTGARLPESARPR